MPKTPLIDPVYDQLMVNECHEHRVAGNCLTLSVCVWHVIETHLPTYCLWHLEPYRVHQDDLKLLCMIWHYVCGTSPKSLTGAWSFGILKSTNMILWTCVIYSHVFGFNPLIHNHLCWSLSCKHKTFLLIADKPSGFLSVSCDSCEPHGHYAFRWPQMQSRQSILIIIIIIIFIIVTSSAV